MAPSAAGGPQSSAGSQSRRLLLQYSTQSPSPSGGVLGGRAGRERSAPGRGAPCRRAALEGAGPRAAASCRV
eukprot:10838042-Alexandrium_andersonii.AAC.1